MSDGARDCPRRFRMQRAIPHQSDRLSPSAYVRYRTLVRNFPIMGRELVWLENADFAAWGCAACAWITPGRRVSGKPTFAVKEAFNKHECANFPRALPARKAPAKADSHHHHSWLVQLGSERSICARLF